MYIYVLVKVTIFNVFSKGYILNVQLLFVFEQILFNSHLMMIFYVWLKISIKLSSGIFGTYSPNNKNTCFVYFLSHVFYFAYRCEDILYIYMHIYKYINHRIYNNQVSLKLKLSFYDIFAIYSLMAENGIWESHKGNHPIIDLYINMMFMCNHNIWSLSQKEEKESFLLELHLPLLYPQNTFDDKNVYVKTKQQCIKNDNSIHASVNDDVFS